MVPGHLATWFNPARAMHKIAVPDIPMSTCSPNKPKTTIATPVAKAIPYNAIGIILIRPVSSDSISLGIRSSFQS